MTKSITWEIAIPAPLKQLFDYLPLAEKRSVKPGVRVKVPFGRQEKIGILISVSTKEKQSNRYTLKSVLEVLDDEPIVPEEMIQLCTWAADYYQDSLGEVLSTAMPALLRKGKPAQLSKKHNPSQWVNAGPISSPLVLNDAQQQAVNAITESQNTFQVFLLEGVTGSGKTEVYLQSMESILNAGKQVLVLVPEIGLTPQTIERFRERFRVPVVGLHSGLTEKERLDAWLLAKQGTASIVIGTRSAVFTPFKNLGLMIVDEEHDLSLKQQDGFRYHARDVAIKRAQLAGIPIVIGSATPSLESLFNAGMGRYHHLLLPERAGIAALPEFLVLDIRKQPLEEGLSAALIQVIREHLHRKEQVMLFLNRRGFAPVWMCHACGWIAECNRCDAKMTYHQQLNELHCHRCERVKPVMKICEHCKGASLQPVGLGTERLEIALKKHFPNESIARIDRDSTQRKGAMEKLLQDIQAGHYPILIGTQMLAKGHHFPNVTLVAIVDADGGFFSSDFRSLERMGQLILQVAGRAGRDEKRGKVIIQTREPHHPLLQLLLKEGYSAFAKQLLLDRAETQLPPYSFLALLRAESHALINSMEFLKQVKTYSTKDQQPIQIAGPFPATLARRAGYHRSQLLFQASSRSHLQQFLKSILSFIESLPAKRKVRWSLDVDPVEIG